MYPLRDYQSKVIRDTYNLVRQKVKRILIFAPTGAGKTIIATKIVSDAVSRNRQVLFVVHREVLISQTFNKFSSAGLRCGFIKAGWTEDKNALVQIASVQTLSKREDWQQLNFEVIIFDECHSVAFYAVCKQMMAKIFPDAIYLGLTATPWRLSKKESLGDVYSGLVCAPKPKELIEAGFLVKPSYYHLEFDVNLNDIDLLNGDYNTLSLSNVCNRPELIEQLCNAWFDLAYGRATIAFAIDVPHAKHIARAFKNHGISSAVVTGQTPIKVRNKLYQRLTEGTLKVLASCDALSEGFDVPRVSCVLLARPTKSKALYFQQLGRGLRLASKKRDCLVLDLAKNVLEHGFIEDLEDIELFSSCDRQQSNNSSPPLKVCPRNNGGCGAYIYSFYLKCPHCKYNFELQKLVSVLGSKHLIRDEDRIKLEFYRTKLREAFSNNFAPSWAAMKFKEQYEFFPPFDWARGAIFNHQKTSIAIYTNYLTAIAKRLNKDCDWIDKYLYLEFGKI